MIKDMLTVLWKEFRELPVASGGGFRGGKFGVLIFLLVFGVYMPLQSGPGWVTSPLSLVYWAWVPFLLVSSVIADSFAGERERHTLETLLASRLSDKAILFGKIAAGVAYGWGMTMACVLSGLVLLNLVHGRQGLLLYSAATGIGIVVLTFLVAALASGLGVLISLRSATVRQAQQTFSFAFLLVFIPIFAIPALPEEWRLGFFSAMVRAETNVMPVVLVAAAILLLLDGLLVAAALARFQRSKLILD